MNQNETKQRNASHNQQQQIPTPSVPYHFQNHAVFENLFINRRAFIYLGILKMFKVA